MPRRAPWPFFHVRRTHAPSSLSRREEQVSQQYVDRQPAWTPPCRWPSSPAKPNADIMPAKPALHRMRLAAAMSAFCTKRTFRGGGPMSGIGGKADIGLMHLKFDYGSSV